MKTQSSFFHHLNRFFIDPKTAKTISFTVVPVVSVTIFLILSQRAAGATNKFWVASNSANFNSANWSLASGGPPNTTAPGSNDFAVFDANGLGNCAITANTSVEGIDIGSGYTGVITVSTGVNLTAGLSGIKQAAGTFNGGNGDIDVNGNFLLSGTGVFNSTTGTLFLGSAFDHNTSTNPGGTFNHNNGTVTFDGETGGIDSELSGTVFKNLNFTHTGGRIVFSRMGGGPTITVLGALALNDGQLFGNQIEVRGSLIISPNFDGASNNHATLVIANGSGPRTITFATGTNMLNLILNDSSATIQTSGSGTLNWRSLTLQAGTINQGTIDFAFPVGLLAAYSQSGGTFNASSNTILMDSKFSQSGGVFNGGSGDIDVNAEFALSDTWVFTSTSGTLFLGGAYTHGSGGTFNHNNGTVVLDGAGFGGIQPSGETFNNVTINLPDGGQRTIFNVLNVLGTLNLNNGTLFGGTLQPQGNVVIANTFDGGSGTAVSFSGPNNQSFTNNGGVNPSGTWTVNKSARVLTLLSDLTLQPGQQLNISVGVLDQGTSSNLVAGPITVGVAGRLQSLGTGDVTLLGNVVNDGFINFNGSGSTCNDPDTVLIRSSIDGTRRMWSGGGSFTFEDVDVKDQEAVLPLTLTAFASTNSGNNVNWSFDSSCNPTAVTLESFTTTRYEAGMLLEWRTGFETRNLGFNLYRESAGQRRLVNRQLIAGSALTAGSTLLAGQGYTWWDEAADCGSTNDDCRNTAYWLEDIDLVGQSTWHGPVFSSDWKFVRSKPRSGSNAPFLNNLGKRSASSDDSRRVVSRATMPKADKMRAVVHAGNGFEKAAKIRVIDEGWYRVSQPQLSSVGFDTKVDPRTLRLYVDGRELAIVVQGEQDARFDPSDSVEFYGMGLESAFTESRTYWLIAGARPGLRVSQKESLGARGLQQSFTSVIEKRDRGIYFAGLLNGELENFFGAVVARNPIDQILTTHHISSLGGTELEVALQGVTLSEHRVMVELNGQPAGSIVFEGQAQGIGKFTFAQGNLREGQNTVRLIPLGGPADVSLVDFIRILYQHTLTADEDHLKLTAAGLQQHTIEGFTSDSIRVVDVTDPDSPQEIIGKIEKRTNGYAIQFASSEAGERSLLAFTDARTPARLTLNAPSNLRVVNADSVIITTRDLAESVQPLVILRRAQGIAITVVDVEDIYDEFSFGQKTPYAIRDFLSYATTTWKRKPRYVLFAGDASYDPNNHLGFGDFDFVSTRLIDTDFIEAASDDWFTDFNGDGICDIATGRLPARTPDELSMMVWKIIRSERADPGKGALLVADANEGYDFELANDDLEKLFPGDLRVTRVNRGRVEPETAKNCLLEAMYRKQLLVNYVGHGSVNLWRGNLLTNEDAIQLRNEHLPMFVMMTCLNGYFDDPALDSLGESLMKAAGGGIAVWASSGMTMPNEQAMVNQALLRLLFSPDQRLTIGEAVRIAKQATTSRDVRRSWILLGDPATKLR